MNNEYVLTESTYLAKDSYIQIFYRIISTIHHQKYFNLYETNKNIGTEVGIHPDKIQIGHTTHNINNDNFWFSYEDFYKILNHKSVNDYNSFKNQYLKILNKRGVEVKNI